MAPTPQAAAEVLQRIGYWPPHVQLNLLTSGITETFRPELEVRILGVSIFWQPGILWVGDGAPPLG